MFQSLRTIAFIVSLTLLNKSIGKRNWLEKLHKKERAKIDKKIRKKGDLKLIQELNRSIIWIY
jgi:hypothetical protein